MIYGFNDNKEKVDVDELLEESSPSLKPDISRVHAPETVYFSKDGEDPNELFGGFWVEDTTGGYQPEGYPMNPQGKKYIKTKGVEAYAVYDSDTFTLTFFRDEEDKYTNGQEIGSKTYYTGVESTSGLSTVRWGYTLDSCKKVIFADHILPTCTAYWFHHPHHYDSGIECIEHLERLHTQNVTSMFGMFWKCTSLSDIQCQYFDTSNVTSMGNMFSSCSSLEVARTEQWDTSNVWNMSSMFRYCTMINNVFIGGDTSNVTDMSNMFYGCERLTSIDTQSMDVSNVTDMHNMFRGTEVSNLHLEFWNTSKVNTTEWMFKDCQYLSTIYVTSDWDMSSVTDDQEMFDGCTLLVGGNGTTYSSSHVESDYAKIDESGSPGYLTESVAYARWDNGNNKELSFFRAAAGTYTNGQVSGNYTYWTDIETSVYTSASECPWYSKRSSVKRCSINGKIRPISTAFWFYGMTNTQFTEFKSPYGSHLIDTSRTVNMKYMFYNCTKLTKIHLFGVDTSNVTDMQYMFYNCIRLREIIISPEPSLYWYKLTESRQKSIAMLAWDTSSVTDMQYMFYSCNVLGYLNLSNWDTSNVKDMSYMFYNCDYLVYLDISSWDTSEVTAMEHMFDSCSYLYTIYVSDKWNTDAVINSYDMFGGNQYLTGGWGTRYTSQYRDKTYARIDYPQDDEPGYLTLYPGKYEQKPEAYAVYDSSDNTLTFFRDDEDKYTNGQTSGTKTYYTGIETSNYAANTQVPWNSNRSNIQNIVFKNKIRPISTSYWFNYCNNSNLTSITHLDYLDTSNVTRMHYMFNYCQYLTQLDVSHFDTSNVTSMYYMFNGCQRLTQLDVSSWSTSNVTSMSSMFNGCQTLTSLDLSHFDTSNVDNMSDMFEYCYYLSTDINIMGMPTYYYDMFYKAAYGSYSAQINVYYISPVTSVGVNALIATKSSDSNVVNAGQGTFTPPTV